MDTVSIPGAPPPAGHYSPAVRHGGLVYVSGQLPIHPGSAPDPAMPLDEQVELALANLQRVLVAAGSDFTHLISVTVYVADSTAWERVNRVYAAVLGSARPARAIVPVPALHHGLAIEVQAIAAIAAD